MNEWVRRSIRLAVSPGYLDRLLEIYPVERQPPREIPTHIKEEIRRAYECRDKIRLIRILLRLRKFPIDNPYVAFLRRYPRALNENPRLIDLLSRELFSMSADEIIGRCEQPKKVSRQYGPLFFNWLKRHFTGLGVPFLPADDLRRYDGPLAFLDGRNTAVMNFANKYLRCNLNKGRDFIAKICGKLYVIGEARFITEYGGEQLDRFRDAIKFIKDRTGDALRIAVLDGVVWLPSDTEMYKTVISLKDDEIALSALLLQDFFSQLSREACV